MTISKKYLVVATSILIIIISAACGMKGDPIAPEKVLIPRVENLSAVLADDTVVLSWSPTMNYSTNKPLELSAAEVYRFDQDVTETLENLRIREEEQEEARKAAGLDTSSSAKKAAGELAGKINLLKMSPVQGFQSDSTLVARIPVEQLLDLAEGGQIYWKTTFKDSRVNSVVKRSVYAIREIDSEGKRSDLSNFVHVYPFVTPPAPRGFNANYTQKGLTITWDTPERGEKDIFMSLKGYNIYKASSNNEFTNVAVNAEPVNYLAPTDWKDVSLSSYQRIKGQNSNYAFLFTTGEEQGSSGISQAIYSAGEINQRIGQEVDVEVSIRSIGSSSPGRIILDATRDPRLARVADEDAVFRYDQDPLVKIENIAISNKLTTFTFSGKVPVGAKGYQIIIEPRGWNAVSGSFVVESVKVSPKGRSESLIKNGDFSATPALKYTEEIKDFGGAYKYRMTSIYEVAGFILESKPTEEVEISFRDTFPPDSPSSVKAQATRDSVSLTWNHSKATDVQGYHVFRRARDERKFKKLTEQPIKNTIFRDRDVKPGTIYFYQVRAIDKAGNTSKDAVAESVEVLERN